MKTIENFFIGIFYIIIFIGLIGFLIGYPLQCIVILLFILITKSD